MTLPSPELQVLYAHLAWAFVLGACGVGVMWRFHPFPTRSAAAWVVLAFTLCMLPGEASVAYWLGLSFQTPSAFLLCLCVLAVWNRGQPRPEDRVLPTGLALGLVLAGLMLYADAWAWVHLGLYVRGFGAEAAFAGLLVGTAAVLAVATGLPRRASIAAIVALTIHALWRLPTGNVWDALIDPLLWGWALCSLLARFARRTGLRGQTAAKA